MSQFLIDNSLLIVVIAVSVLGLLIPVINTRRYAPEVSPAQATELINRQGASARRPTSRRDTSPTAATFPPTRSRTNSASSSASAP